MFERWRYRGRHRGYFLDSYRSVEAFARAEEINARWCAILDADIQRDLDAMHRAQIEALLPPRHGGFVGQVLVRDYVHDLGPRPGFDAFDNPPSLLTHIMRWREIDHGPAVPPFDPLPADVAEVRVEPADTPLWMPLGRHPTIVFDAPCRRDRSGLSLWNLEQLAADLGMTWPTVTVRLWLRDAELDEDDQARYDRLMGMAGA
jgi:hypothetical protein